MGRAGAGGSEGSHNSSGHSAEHSSGGHRIGGSGRAGVGGSGGSFNPLGSFGSGGSMMDTIGREIQRGIGREIGHQVVRNVTRGFTQNNGGYYNNPGYSGGGSGFSQNRRRSGGSGILSQVVWLIIAVVILVVAGGALRKTTGGSSAASTIQREKVESGNAYINDCVVDELGWINNPSKLSSRLKTFWNKTGVQPYIYLKAYDSGLTSDAAKTEWTENYYDNTFDTENVFLYVYFAEPSDSAIGYMTYCNGLQTGQVMDAEALDIFWGYLDSYWQSYDEDDTDGMFAEVFEKTGNTIMKVSTTSKDIVKYALIAVIILSIVIGTFCILKLIRRNERERAEETERILNAGSGNTGSSSSDDDSWSRYD